MLWPTPIDTGLSPWRSHLEPPGRGKAYWGRGWRREDGEGEELNGGRQAGGRTRSGGGRLGQTVAQNLMPPPWPERPARVSLVLFPPNNRCRSKETYWGNWGFTWGKGANPPLPQGDFCCCCGSIGYSSSNFGTAAALGARQFRIGLLIKQA